MNTSSPWDRLAKAAKEAQDLIAAEHYNATAGDWDSDDAMQVFENIECALLDIAETEPELLAACKDAADLLKPRQGKVDLVRGGDAHVVHKRLTAALDKCKQEGRS